MVETSSLAGSTAMKSPVDVPISRSFQASRRWIWRRKPLISTQVASSAPVSACSKEISLASGRTRLLTLSNLEAITTGANGPMEVTPCTSTFRPGRFGAEVDCPRMTQIPPLESWIKKNGELTWDHVTTPVSQTGNPSIASGADISSTCWARRKVVRFGWTTGTVAWFLSRRKSPLRSRHSVPMMAGNPTASIWALMGQSVVCPVCTSTCPLSSRILTYRPDSCALTWPTMCTRRSAGRRGKVSIGTTGVWKCGSSSRRLTMVRCFRPGTRISREASLSSGPILGL